MGNRKSNKEAHALLFNRYIWLVDTIFSRGRITFEEISERWCRSQLNNSGDELPLRTFHNHRSAIEEMFDINIECDRSGGYTYYIENSDDMERGGVRGWLINTFAVNNLINESHKLKSRILFEEIPSGQNFLTPIIEAMRDGVVLELEYQKFQAEEPKIYTIEPYCVKVFHRRWYVLGRCEGKDYLTTFGLDRIHSIRSTDGTYEMAEDFDGEAYFEHAYGIVVDEEMGVERVQLKVIDRKANYLRTLPLHHSQREVEGSGEGYTLFEYDVIPTYDFRQEVLSHGAEVEVLAPEHFRAELAAIASQQYETYKQASENV